MSLQDKPATAGRYVSSVWSFAERDEADARSPYRWYGTLPGALVDQLLDLYAAPETHVLDPFSGAGTVVIGAAARGHRATGLDVNPLAVLVARARADVPVREALLAAWAGVLRAVDSPAFAHDAARTLRDALRTGELGYTAKWFGPEALARSWALVRAIGTVADPVAARWLFVHAATAIRTVANVDPRCTHHLVTKLKPYADPVSLVSSMVDERRRPERTLNTAVFEQGDATKLPAGTEHDLVVAHPPYLGVIHYNQIHRLATDLFGLGARIDAPDVLTGLDWRFDDLKAGDMSTDNGDRYELFISRVADNLVKATAVGGRAVVIIGDQRNKGLLRHPFTSYVRELESRGLALEENFIWVLQNNGGMHVLRRGNFIDHNYVMVFRRLP